MSRRRWPLWLAPPIALIATAVVLGRLQPLVEAGGRHSPAPPGACPSAPLANDSAAATGSAWWTLTDRIDHTGTLAGHVLAVGRGGAAGLTLELPAEASVSGPVRGAVLAASDDGRSSRLRVVSASGACSWLIDETFDVVRGAVLDPADGSVLAHLVDRATRADLGTWRFGGGGALGEPTIVLGPLPRGRLDGPAWTTELRLDAAAGLLAVQSCADTGCATRLVDLSGDGPRVRELAGRQGSLVGLVGGRVLTWARCPGVFPCGVEAWDLETGTVVTILDGAQAAAITADGRYLAATVDGHTGRTIRIDLASGARALVVGPPAGEFVLADGAAAVAGLEVADDEIAVMTPGGIPHPFRPAAAEVIP